MGKVCVDQNKCIGCGACVAINPENFDFNDEGLSEVKNETPTEKTVDAVEACPVFAISVEESCDCKHGGECTCGDDCNCDDDCGCKHGEECTCGDDCECGEDCPCHNEEEQEETE